MTVVLYRPSLDARSGAGQLLEMQRRALRAAGVPAIVACERGALRFWLRTGVRARRCSLRDLERLRADGAALIDHGMSVSNAELAFVHNLASEVARHSSQGVSAAALERERQFFGSLHADTVVVANSHLVAAALHAHFNLARQRIHVLYPGYRGGRFTQQRAAALRAAARSALGMASKTPLVGLVTSGDFAKRGLDLFLECASRIADARPDVRFLVVGSKELPQNARSHELVRRGAVLHRPKSRHPERWFAALDLFLYPARFEEYGMVVAEAQAMGVPVLTSRLVGAAECLPSEYAPWLLERPEPTTMAVRALELLGDPALRAGLVTAAAASIVAFDDRAYGAGTRTLLAARTGGSGR